MILAAFYSHPWAWNEIGFGGPAYPRGYMRLGPTSTREPFERRAPPPRTRSGPSPKVERVIRHSAEGRGRPEGQRLALPPRRAPPRPARRGHDAPLRRRRRGRPLHRRRRRRRVGAGPAPGPGRLAGRDHRSRPVLASRRGLGLRRGRLARAVLEPEADHRRRRPHRDGQEQLRARRRRVDGPLRRLLPPLSPLRLPDPRPSTGSAPTGRSTTRTSAPTTRRSSASCPWPARTGRGATRTRYPFSPHPVSEAASVLWRGAIAQGITDARRPGRHRQRHLRQPPALHLPGLLPAGLQGQRQGQPVRHPPARRPGPRRRDPSQLHGGPRRDRPGQRAGDRRHLHPRGRDTSSACSGPRSWPWPATRSRRRGCCSTPPQRASRTASATTRTRSAAT